MQNGRLGHNALKRTGAVALAIVLAGSAILGGRRYVWCAPMAEARERCCCPHEPSEYDTVRIECCEDRVAPSLPSAEQSDPVMPPVASPLRTAVIAIALFYRGFVPRPVRSSAPLARGGPGERVHAIASVYLI